jgi:transposase
LNEVEFQQKSGADSFQILIEQVKTLRNHLLEVNKKVRALSKEKYYQKREALLRTIPGIGLITAMIILTEIGDIHRFANQEKGVDMRAY